MTTMRSILAVLVCAGVAAACGEDRDPSFAGSGVIEATEVTVGTKTPGTLMTFAVDAGVGVAAGDTIAVIDVDTVRLQREVAAADMEDIDWNERILASEIESAREQMSQASLRLGLAEKTRDRVAALHGQGAATTDRLDAAETELALSESAVRAAETRLAEVTVQRDALAAKRAKIDANLRLLDRNIADGAILAPLGGEVTETFADAGEVVMTGAPLCTIADLSEVTLRIYVDEGLVGLITLGGEAAVAVDSHPGETFPGRVSWISPEAEFTPKNVQTRESRADLVYAVEITLSNPGGVFKIGMPADAFIPGIVR